MAILLPLVAAAIGVVAGVIVHGAGHRVAVDVDRRNLVLVVSSRGPHRAAPARRTPAVILRGISTTYWPGDPSGTGSNLACVGAARRILGRSTLRATDYVIATRGKRRPFACGQRVLVTHVVSRRSVYAHKIDVGPFGQDCPGPQPNIGPPDGQVPPLVPARNAQSGEPLGDPSSRALPTAWARRVALRLGPGCRWRGVADLTPAVARAIGHDGFDLVEIR
jgi:hypothetical protein